MAGKIPQLRNVIERALVVSNGPLLSVNELPPESAAETDADPSFEVSLGGRIEEVEKDLILRKVDLTDGNKAHAAGDFTDNLKTQYSRLE